MATETASGPMPASGGAMRSEMRISEIVGFVAMLAFLVVAPSFIYPLFLMQVLCFAIFACAFNLLIGYVGLLSFGHAAYFGMGGYIAGYTAKAWGFTPEVAVSVPPRIATSGGIGGSGMTNQCQPPAQYGMLMAPILARCALT